MSDLYPVADSDVPWVGRTAVAVGGVSVAAGVLLSAGATWVAVGVWRRLRARREVPSRA